MHKHEVAPDHMYFSSDYFAMTNAAQEDLILPLLSASLKIHTRFKAAIARFPFVDIKGKIGIISQISKGVWPFNKHPELLGCLNKFERMLRALDKRDHYVHQFNVFLLGWQILSALYKKEPELTNGESIKDSLLAWFTASIFHDIGYVLESLPKALLFFEGIYRELELNPLADQFQMLSQETCSTFLPDIKTSLFSNLSPDKCLKSFIEESLDVSPSISSAVLADLANTNNHGLFSALLFLKSLPDSYFHPTNRNRKKLSRVASAICLHSINPTHIQSEFFNAKKNIYALTLFISDTLQDWSRDYYIDTEWPTFMLKSICSTESKIEMSILIKNADWSDPVIKKIKDAVNAKKKVLEQLNTSLYSLDLVVTYSSVNGYINESIHLKF